jgi:uncharacterized membrane protein YfcA
MELVILLVMAASTLLAVVSQLLTGFGFVLVLVPLLMLVMPSVQAVVATTLVAAVLTTALFIRDRQYVDLHTAARLTLWGIVGLPIGIFILNNASAKFHQGLIISVVLIALLIVAANVSIKANRWLTMFAGLMSGALLTSTGFNGPPLVALVRANNYSVRQYRATLAAIFCVQGWAAVIALVIAQKTTLYTLSLSGIGILVVPLGFVIGERLFKHIDARRLRFGITIMLLLCMGSVLMK